MLEIVVSALCWSCLLNWPLPLLQAPAPDQRSGWPGLSCSGWRLEWSSTTVLLDSCHNQQPAFLPPFSLHEAVCERRLRLLTSPRCVRPPAAMRTLAPWQPDAHDKHPQSRDTAALIPPDMARTAACLCPWRPAGHPSATVPAWSHARRTLHAVSLLEAHPSDHGGGKLGCRPPRHKQPTRRRRRRHCLTHMLCVVARSSGLVARGPLHARHPVFNPWGLCCEQG